MTSFRKTKKAYKKITKGWFPPNDCHISNKIWKRLVGRVIHRGILAGPPRFKPIPLLDFEVDVAQEEYDRMAFGSFSFPEGKPVFLFPSHHCEINTNDGQQVAGECNGWCPTCPLNDYCEHTTWNEKN